jgi:outer membrane protein assembly factor BamB
VATTVEIHGDLAFFSGRKGMVVCVSLSEESIVWQRKLVEGVTTEVFHDLECGPEGVFVFSKGRLHGLALRNGDNLFTPIADLASPPLYRDGLLYFGTRDKSFKRAEAGTGRIERSLALNNALGTRPLFHQGRLFLGTRAGRLIIIDPRGMR